MLVLTAVCMAAPHEIIRFFNADVAVVAFGAEYLSIVSTVFVLNGIIFVSSSVFQGMGHTLPALASSILRLILFAVPSYLVSRHPGFQMRHIWYFAVASVLVQLVASLWLLHREFARKLHFPETVPAVEV
jgi:Na+-driven multidrug efflux pump